MIYTELTKKAMRIAFDVHKEQTDKTGMPYIFHPILVANQMTDEITTCVALLHDVLEDGKITLDYLKKQGFSDEMLGALKVLTHDENVPYMDYIAEVKKNKIATKVKLADLKHNSDITRLSFIDEKSIYRMQKYKVAIALLTDGKDKKEKKTASKTAKTTKTTKTSKAGTKSKSSDKKTTKKSTKKSEK